MVCSGLRGDKGNKTLLRWHWSMAYSLHFQEAGDNIAVAVECCDLGRAHHRARCHLPTADKLVLIDARRIKKELMLAQGNTAFQATVYGCMTTPRLELVMQGTGLRPARRWVVGKSCYKLSLKERLGSFQGEGGEACPIWLTHNAEGSRLSSWFPR